MKIEKRFTRLKAIKTRYPRILPVKCKRCGDSFISEKVFKVERWSINRTSNSEYYCKECMPTKEDVLNHIDGMVNIFGIAYVDDFPRNAKG